MISWYLAAAPPASCSSRSWPQAATRLTRVAVVDSGPGRLGAGTAYATADPLHLLNVRADALSAWPDDPRHFVTWLSATTGTVRPSEFVPRARYGAYLAAVAHDAANGASVRAEHLRCQAVELARTPDGWRVLLDSGAVLTATSVVLATGVNAPSTGWAPAALAAHPRFIPNPWRPGALDRIGPHDPVLLVGTGLTAVDIALTLTRTDRPVVMVSRHGWLPAPHTRIPRQPLVLDDAELPSTLAGTRRLLRRLIADCRAAGDWRPAVDGVRPHAQRLWTSWPATDRAEFLRRDRRRWEVARHRMPPEAAARIAELRATGQLAVVRGDGATVASAASAAGDWVVNAAGPEADPRASGDRLLRTLLATGNAAAGPLGLGLSTDSAGRVRDRGGVAVPGLYTLGATRRGQLWESTAIPEIRAQAAALAQLLAALPHAHWAGRDS